MLARISLSFAVLFLCADTVMAQNKFQDYHWNRADAMAAQNHHWNKNQQLGGSGNKQLFQPALYPPIPPHAGHGPYRFIDPFFLLRIKGQIAFEAIHDQRLGYEFGSPTFGASQSRYQNSFGPVRGLQSSISNSHLNPQGGFFVEPSPAPLRQTVRHSPTMPSIVEPAPQVPRTQERNSPPEEGRQ